MLAAGVGLGLVLLFLAADALGERLPARARAVPRLALAALLALAGVELARNDHGLASVVFPIAFVAAPIVVIFGGAAAGVRRFYGWPDLGPMPGRLAGVACGLLVGVLAGTRIREADLEASMARGRDVRTALVARHAATGRWPATVAEALPDAPTTRLGWIDPPAFAWDPAAARLSFPLSARTSLVLDAATAGATWRRVDR